MSELSWVAVYADGDTLPQYNRDGTENKYKDIDRSRLTEFNLYTAEGVLRYALFLDPGQRLIWRRRVSLTSQGGRSVIHLIGWQMTVGDQNIQSISYVPEVGQATLSAGRFREDHPLFYSLVPHEEETS